MNVPPIRSVNPFGGPAPSARQGVTLTEVLISLMIMSLGLVGVATLFPLAVLRSIQATQLTNGTILRYNAEQLARIDMALIFDPNRDGNLAEHDNKLYVVDPLGHSIQRSDASGLEGQYGNDGGTAVSRLGRFGGYTVTANANNDVNTANAIATSPDTWNLIELATADSSVTPTSTSVTVASLSGSTGDRVDRVVLFDSTGKYSQTRPVQAIDYPTKRIDWTTPLPAWFIPDGDVRLEVQERRYTYLFAVRNKGVVGSDRTAEVDVVVFFRRGFSPVDEQVYTASFVQGSTQVTFNLPTNSALNPTLRKGSYVVDADRNLWYQILDYRLTTTQATLTIERPSDFTSPVSGGNPDGRALVPTGIVEVYPLGTMVLKQ